MPIRSFMLPAGKGLSGAHFIDHLQHKRRYYVITESADDYAAMLERFVGTHYSDQKLTEFPDANLDGSDEMILTLHATRRFLGSVRIVANIQIYEKKEPEEWAFKEEWIVAREGEKERVLYSTDVGESTSPAGYALAQQILKMF
ncbi:hypothetical protein EVB78_095 [Rhizobium phage RHph_N1_15]|nr:hypothetical protein EVB77_095 [Rhizobium phage RHph_N1_10]QIG69297.1 hypothetical protein EVB78_095 [Rhizobium phage RHph_N1_15]QIG75157.1 hypothetical protein EVC15_095 [Rhizobium phage RHph_N2_6]